MAATIRITKSMEESQKKQTRINSDMKYIRGDIDTKPIEITTVNIDKKHSEGNEIIRKPMETTVSSMIHDDMVEYEILSRLPVKSLMRFKCVCKRWESLIKEDPNFVSLHFARSQTQPCLFIVTVSKAKQPLSHCPGHWGDHLGGESQGNQSHGHLCVESQGSHQSHEYLWSTNLLRREDETITIFSTMKTNPCVTAIFRPVNGLICMVDYDFHSGYQHDIVRIYNPSTREFITPWIKPNFERKNTKTEYSFGFDPVRKVHKVICLWEEYDNSNIFCEVLTVGQTTWRRIHAQVPSYDFIYENSYYWGGCLYWSNILKNQEEDEDEVLVVFDVGREKFRVISVPNLINDRPLDTTSVYNGMVVGLLEVDGRVAILRKMSSYIVKLCIFDDDHGYICKKSTNATTSTSDKSWTEVSITLPFCWDKNKSVNFHSVPGTYQIILVTCEDSIHRKISSTLLYFYNWGKKTFEKVNIDEIPSSTRCQPSAHATAPFHSPIFSSSSSRYQPSAHVTLVAPFVESLWPVRKQGVAKPQTSN